MEQNETDEKDSDIGAEGGASDSADSLPAAPTGDDSEVGSTDQHSSSDA